MHLYQITEGYVALQDVDSEDFAAALADLKASFEDKAENLTYVIKNLEAEAAPFLAEAKRLQERAQARRNRVEWLKAYLLQNMQATGLRKIERPTVTVAIAKNPQAVAVDDERQVPSEFWVPQPPKLDKAAVLAKLKAGEEVSGTRLVQRERLTIK